MRAGIGKFLAVGLVALFAQGTMMAQASPRDGSKSTAAFDACMNSGDAAKGITVGMLDCIHAEIHRQDVRLNRAYQSLMARLDPVRRQKLRRSERAWINHREANCTRDARDQEGGTTWLLIYNQCIAVEEQFRANFLEHYR
jgi:uncharacterized protein YecT (DUF1311 family)